jgi:hypothetical protein
VAFAHIQEPQGAARTLAFADEGEILFADEVAKVPALDKVLETSRAE